MAWLPCNAHESSSSSGGSVSHRACTCGSAKPPVLLSTNFSHSQPHLFAAQGQPPCTGVQWAPPCSSAVCWSELAGAWCSWTRLRGSSCEARSRSGHF